MKEIKRVKGNPIILAVQPKYATRIFAGKKRVELRRVRPRLLEKGSVAFVYVSSPICSLVGAFRVEKVIEGPVEELWKKVYRKAGVSREEFDEYYEGASLGVALFFSHVRSFREPIVLEKLRSLIVGFRPPQSFRYANGADFLLPEFSEFT